MSEPFSDLIYNPETGDLVWAQVKHNGSKGRIAGYTNSEGYVIIKYRGKRYGAHRIIWMKYHGDIESGMEIDHINGIRNDNRIENLRLATKNQNIHNSKLHSKSKTGVKGLSFKKEGIYTYLQACVMVNGVKHLKRFKLDQKSLAIEWLNTTRRSLHGEFARNK